MITQNEVDRERYESRLKMQRDVYTALAEAEEKGIEKGRQEGRAKGQIARIVSFQRLLCRNIMTLDQLHALSLADLETVAARLEAELASNLVGGT